MPPRRRKLEKVLRWDFVPELLQEEPPPRDARVRDLPGPYSSGATSSGAQRAPSRTSRSPSRTTSGDLEQP
eukprot:15103302-Alexandrium_andersonii.AAC.1